MNVSSLLLSAIEQDNKLRLILEQKWFRHRLHSKSELFLKRLYGLSTVWFSKACKHLNPIEYDEISAHA